LRATINCSKLIAAPYVSACRTDESWGSKIQLILCQARRLTIS
jgi:hypothetical protein